MNKIVVWVNCGRYEIGRYLFDVTKNLLAESGDVKRAMFSSLSIIVHVDEENVVEIRFRAQSVNFGTRDIPDELRGVGMGLICPIDYETYEGIIENYDSDRGPSFGKLLMNYKKALDETVVKPIRRRMSDVSS